MDKLIALRRCLANDIRGLNIVEDPDMEGFGLVDPLSGWMMYTAYVADDGYSVYVATPDIWTGHDVEDEKPLRIKVSLFAAVSAIKSHHVGIAPHLYATAPAIMTRTDYSDWQRRNRP